MPDELLPGPEHLDELPGWLTYSPRPKVDLPPPPPPGSQDATRLQAAARAALTGELGKLDAHPTEAGTGRHTALYAAAAALGHHVASGGIGRAEVEAALWATVPQLGLAHDGEAWHQVQSGLDDGAVEPYVLTERPLASSTNGATPPPTSAAAPAAHLRLRHLRELRMRRVEWAWDERIPLGKLTVLGGLAGQGKSLLTCWLGSRASKGELPGTLEGRPVPVLLVSGEDDPEDTTMPRVLRTGGAPELIHVVDVRMPSGAGEYTRSVSLPGDTQAILKALEVTGAKLVVLDPISGLLDSEVDIYKSQAVRKALGPLKQAAEDLHVAVVLVTHVLPKGQGSDPLQRLADSHAFSGLPRSVLIFGPDPEDEQGDRGRSKVLAVAKSNLAGPGEHGLAFTITGGELVGDPTIGVGYSASIQLEGASASSAADTLSTGDERSALREAAEWLRGELAAGPQQAGAMQRAAEAAGISLKTLRRAREKVCKRPYKQGEGPWYWELRDPPGHLGHVGHVPQPMPDQEGAHGAQGAHVVLQMFPDEPNPEETT
jgi:putative DNA primase/helicase